MRHGSHVPSPVSQALARYRFERRRNGKARHSGESRTPVSPELSLIPIRHRVMDQQPFGQREVDRLRQRQDRQRIPSLIPTKSGQVPIAGFIRLHRLGQINAGVEFCGEFAQFHIALVPYPEPGGLGLRLFDRIRHQRIFTMKYVTLGLCGAMLALSACGTTVGERAATGGLGGAAVAGPAGAVVGGTVGAVSATQ